MPIHAWPLSERPREKLLADGACTLSDAELLALFLHTGRKGQSAIELARALLLRFGSLSGVFAADQTQLAAVCGIGPAKYAVLKGVLEMAKRTLAETLTQAPVLDCVDAVHDFLRLELGHRPCEVFFALFLDTQNRLIDARELARGTLDHTRVYPREVVKAALLANAAAVIFAHNHPTGDASPSQHDERLTRMLKTALAMIEVKTLDHVVVAGNNVFSFAEQGMV